VAYTSSAQAAGGQWRSSAGRALFRTHALYQNIAPGGVVANRVEFALCGVPGAVGLEGPLRPVEPLRVAAAAVATPSATGEPEPEARASADAAGAPAAAARTFPGAVEVAFEAPFLEVAGARVTLGGPSSVRLATTYLDGRIRVGRGGFGSLFVFERMAPGAQAAAALVPSPAQRAAGAVLARVALALVTTVSLGAAAARLLARAATQPAVGLPAAAAAAALATSAHAPAAAALAAATAAAGAAPAAAAAHLLAAATWLGAAAWVTFGQGDVLYRQLPRHSFSRLRAAIRPRFLAASVALGALALAAHAAAYGAAGGATADVAFTQRLLAAALAAAAVNHLVAEPAGARLAALRDAAEADAGIGAEVGAPPDAAKITPALRRLGVRLARRRVAAASLSLASLASLAAHLACTAARLAA
jgi:hypothetical protein